MDSRSLSSVSTEHLSMFLTCSLKTHVRRDKENIKIVTLCLVKLDQNDKNVSKACFNAYDSLDHFHFLN